MELIVQPHGERTLGDVLRAALTGELGPYGSLLAAVAFVRRSGVRYIESELRHFVDEGGTVLMVVGVDQEGTSVEGLTDLLTAVGDAGEIWVSHDEDRYVTFHPKVFLFEGEASALLIVGSGNLTLGGLYTNDEVSSVSPMDPTDEDDAEALRQIKAGVQSWSRPGSGTARRLDWTLIRELQEAGYVAPEAVLRHEGAAEARSAAGVAAEGLGAHGASTRPLFERGAARRVPRRPTHPGPRAAPGTVAPAPAPEPRGFVMTLMRTDVGVGQTTSGTSRRSPEIFVPVGARNTHPGFWGWSNEFTEDPTKPGKFDRPGVPMRLGGAVIMVNMMTWPDRDDFRLRNESLRSAGVEGDILRVEKPDEEQEFAYDVEIIPQGTTTYAYYLTVCTEATPNSDRVWGYYTD